MYNPTCLAIIFVSTFNFYLQSEHLRIVQMKFTFANCWMEKHFVKGLKTVRVWWGFRHAIRPLLRELHQMEQCLIWSQTQQLKPKCLKWRTYKRNMRWNLDFLPVRWRNLPLLWQRLTKADGCQEVRSWQLDPRTLCPKVQIMLCCGCFSSLLQAK